MTREEICAATVTLNGEPAKVVGLRREFPKVVQIESGLGAEWSWQAAEHVITEKGGRFYS